METNKNITEISRDTGFSNITHFNRVFKSVMGMTPSNFRKMYKTEAGHGRGRFDSGPARREPGCKDAEGAALCGVQYAVLHPVGPGYVFVVDGHLNNSYLDIGGLVPYYSFHMPLFAFISGYFYKKGSEHRLGAYTKKKIIRLLGPYMVYNLIYGMIVQGLHRAGFAFGGDLSLWNLFVEPFITGHQFEYNLAAWFVPALFLVEMANVLLRRLLKRVDSEYAVFFLYLSIGVWGILLAFSGRYQGGWLTLVRMMFLLPCYGAGTLYKEKLEAGDRADHGLYFGIILAAWLLLAMSGRPSSTPWPSATVLQES